MHRYVYIYIPHFFAWFSTKRCWYSTKLLGMNSCRCCKQRGTDRWFMTTSGWGRKLSRQDSGDLPNTCQYEMITTTCAVPSISKIWLIDKISWIAYKVGPYLVAHIFIDWKGHVSKKLMITTPSGPGRSKDTDLRTMYPGIPRKHSASTPLAFYFITKASEQKECRWNGGFSGHVPDSTIDTWSGS